MPKKRHGTIFTFLTLSSMNILFILFTYSIIIPSTFSNSQLFGLLLPGLATCSHRKQLRVIFFPREGRFISLRNFSSAQMTNCSEQFCFVKVKAMAILFDMMSAEINLLTITYNILQNGTIPQYRNNFHEIAIHLNILLLTSN